MNAFATSKPFSMISTGLIAAIALTACGDGGDDPAPAQPLMKLTAANMLDAAAVGATADRRASGEFATLLGAVLAHYTNQAAAGTYPCPKSGSLTLTRGASSFSFSADKCDDGKLNLIGSGVVEIDYADVDKAGLGFNIRDIVYTQADGVTPVSTLNGKYRFLIPSKEDVNKSSTGELSVLRQGVTHVYTEHFTEGKNSDRNYLKQGVKVKTPRFPHELSVIWDKPSDSYTLTASDGSAVTMKRNAATGGATLELRNAANTAAVSTLSVSAAELNAAMDKAR